MPVEQTMAQAAAHKGDVMRVLRAVVAASASCALSTRGSFSCPLVRNPKMDTARKPFLPRGDYGPPRLNNCFDLDGSAQCGPDAVWARFSGLRKSKTGRKLSDSGALSHLRSSFSRFFRQIHGQ